MAQADGLAEWMAGEGVCAMAYHHHMGTVVENQREIDLLMAHSGPAVGLLLDMRPSRLCRRGYPRDDSSPWQAHQSRPLQGYPARGAAPRPRATRSFLAAILEGVFTVPGDGMIDYYALPAAWPKPAIRAGSSVEAEQDPAKAPPGAYSAMGRRHLAEAFGAAGFTIRE